ncbi:nucleoside diphosphate kinase 1-like isoform X2 [Silene latifolia]|uniref:nucleoside diphosphate kinase 1-like isoform X2 n=1 Tax=Silene latifolia TaxID=37657 RepID=UPI003D78AB19
MFMTRFLNNLQVGEIISRFEKKGFFLRGLKFTKADRPTIEKHYKNSIAKPYFDMLVDYMISSPVVAMVWEGKGVIAGGRKLIGSTDPLATMPGTIRGDFSIDIGRKIQHGNVIHGSDSLEEAKDEIALWFPEEERIVNWHSSLQPWIYE